MRACVRGRVFEIHSSSILFLSFSCYCVWQYTIRKYSRCNQYICDIRRMGHAKPDQTKVFIKIVAAFSLCFAFAWIYFCFAFCFPLNLFFPLLSLTLHWCVPLLLFVLYTRHTGTHIANVIRSVTQQNHTVEQRASQSKRE